MKTYLKKVISRLDRLQPWLIACALGVTAQNLAAEGTAATEPAEVMGDDQGYTMYMGSDFAIEQNKKYHSIQDVQGTAFVIKIKGKETYIPMRARDVNIKIEQALKIAPHEAKLVNLKTERAYTPDNDPFRQFVASSGGALADMAEADLANYKQQQAQERYTSVSQNPNATAAERNQAQNNLQMASQQSASATHNSMFSKQYDSGVLAGNMANAQSEEMFDALRIAFTVSSATPLDRPYVVIVARYREKGDKADSARNWICAKALHPIGAKPTKIYMLQGGLPPGYVLDDTQVRLYNRGKEIATTVAPKRVTLTLEEAFDYLLLSYLKRNKEASNAATVAVGKLSAEAKSRVNPGQWQRGYYVKVVKDSGVAQNVYLDAACTLPAEPVIAALLENYRFFPALEKGKPVDGTAYVELPKLEV